MPGGINLNTPINVGIFLCCGRDFPPALPLVGCGQARLPVRLWQAPEQASLVRAGPPAGRQPVYPPLAGPTLWVAGRGMGREIIV